MPAYDNWEQEAIFQKQLAEKGFNPQVYPFRDWTEDSRTFDKVPKKPRHQQELWWRNRERQKDEVGGEGMSPGATPGYWAGTPATFMAMPAGNTISLTVEFMKGGARAVCSWDKEDLPPNLTEEQALAKITEFLENNIPGLLSSFKSLKTEDVDLENRLITLKVDK